MNVFVSIIIGLIVINIIYAILPSNSYNKYIKTVVGIIFLLYAVTSIKNITIDSSFYNLKEESILFENGEYKEVLNRQLEATINEKISHEIEKQLHIKTLVKTDVENNDICSIEVICEDQSLRNKLTDFLMKTYNLEKERIIIN